MSDCFGFTQVCSRLVPRMYHACITHVPGLHLPIPSQLPGLHLACTSHVPGFRRLFPPFLLSSFAGWLLWDGSGMALASPVSGFSFQHFSFSAFQHRPPPSDFSFLLS